MTTMKRGDLLPLYTSTLEAPAGVPIDLTGCTVKFIMTVAGGSTPKVSAAATVVSAAAGTVRYDWTGSDTDTVGSYRAVWEITYPSTKKRTVPSRGYLPIEIQDDLG